MPPAHASRSTLVMHSGTAGGTHLLSPVVCPNTLRGFEVVPIESVVSLDLDGRFPIFFFSCSYYANVHSFLASWKWGWGNGQEEGCSLICLLFGGPAATKFCPLPRSLLASSPGLSAGLCRPGSGTPRRPWACTGGSSHLWVPRLAAQLCSRPTGHPQTGQSAWGAGGKPTDDCPVV